MEVNIIKAQKNNLLEVLYIVRECSKQLLGKGVKYWNNSLADYHEISRDIDAEYIYLIKYNHVAVGTVTLRVNTEGNYLQIERLAIFPTFQKKGLAKKLIEFAKNLAQINNIHILVGNIPFDDRNLIHLLENNQFIRKSEQFLKDTKSFTIEFECKL
mgnify:CR=1 FL=1